MKKDDTVFLKHILDAIALIETYLKGVSFERFFQDRLIQDGVVHELEIIGEASRNISKERIWGIIFNIIAEYRRRAFLIFAAVDGSVNHADGVDADLDWVFNWGCHLAAGKPVLSVNATAGGELRELMLGERISKF